MNYMKKQSLDEKKLAQMADTVGDFIRYWGFRRIHGQIWTQVFLSKEALSGADLTKRLSVSKALVSPALSELEAYGLITSHNKDKKTKTYQACPDVVGVIKKILAEREQVLIVTAAHRVSELKKSVKDDQHALVDIERLKRLSEMIEFAQLGVHFLLAQSM
jgi:DNA-binding transcriptional regulator GbsR (MarR family)